MSEAKKKRYSIHRGTNSAFILLLHGLGINKTCFLELEGLLKEKNISYLNVDLPGHGFAWDVTVRSYEEISDYISEILMIEEIEEIVPFGYSLGGFVALALSGFLRNRVKGMILLASSWEMSLGTLRKSFLFLGFPVCTFINFIVRTFHPLPDPEVNFSTPICKNNDLFMVWQSSFATGWRGSNMIAGIMRGKSFENEVKTLDCPVTLVVPENDQVFSRRAYKKFARLLPHSTVVCIRATHNIVGQWKAILSSLEKVESWPYQLS